MHRMMALGCAMLLPVGALAQTDRLQSEINKCATLADVQTRVACYDALARPEPARSPPKTPPQATKVESFGQAPARIERNEKQDESLVAKVASLKEVETNKLQVTLANGQVWRQTTAKAFLLRAGDTVRIAGSGWGRGFRLELEGHPGYIPVTRVQ